MTFQYSNINSYMQMQQSCKNGGALREKELKMKKIQHPIKRCLAMQEMPF